MSNPTGRAWDESDDMDVDFEQPTPPRRPQGLRPRRADEVQEGEFRIIEEDDTPAARPAGPPPRNTGQQARPTARRTTAADFEQLDETDDDLLEYDDQPVRRVSRYDAPRQASRSYDAPRQSSRSYDYDGAPPRRSYVDAPPPRQPYPPGYYPVQPRRFGGWSLVGVGCFGVLISLIILIAVVAATGGNLLGGIGSFFGNMFNGAPVTTSVNLTSPAVVRSQLLVNQLVTVKTSIDKIVIGTQRGGFLNTQDADLMFVAHGEVLAGINMAELRESDIVMTQTISGTRSIAIRLPAADIISFKLDEQRSKVFDVKESSWFTKPQPQLYDQVRAEAERAIRAAAIEDGILEVARQNAEKDVELMLRRLGFTEVTFLAPRPRPTPTPDPAATRAPLSRLLRSTGLAAAHHHHEEHGITVSRFLVLTFAADHDVGLGLRQRAAFNQHAPVFVHVGVVVRSTQPLKGFMADLVASRSQYLNIELLKARRRHELPQLAANASVAPALGLLGD